MYGGHTTNSGTAAMQFFRQTSKQQICYRQPGKRLVGGIVTGEIFTCNLRRMGSDRLFSIRFDISKTIAAPVAPRGLKR
ncbi:MAG: hypothetical protein IPL50_07170 [Chitinophagaceae bacterium]|nr:hypothetical protein [Chitinophagaceae bacterium]